MEKVRVVPFGVLQRAARAPWSLLAQLSIQPSACFHSKATYKRLASVKMLDVIGQAFAS